MLDLFGWGLREEKCHPIFFYLLYGASLKHYLKFLYSCCLDATTISIEPNTKINLHYLKFGVSI